MRKPTIYEIKREVSPYTHFFDRDTMRFFGQRLADFKVAFVETCGVSHCDIYRISCPDKCGNVTIRYYINGIPDLFLDMVMAKNVCYRIASIGLTAVRATYKG